MNHTRHTNDQLAITQKMSWIVFDDIFFIYTPDQILSQAYSFAVSGQRLEFSALDPHPVNLIVDTPFQLTPEEAFNEDIQGILMQAVHPYTSFQNNRIKTDTWIGQYAKCSYYLPDHLYRIKAKNHWHWMTCLTKYGQSFFDEVHTGLFSIRLMDIVYVIVQVNKTIKEAVRLKVPSPDDSAFHILKLVEKYKAVQAEFTLLTNENTPSHIRILKKYVKEVRILKQDNATIIKAIIHTACES